ncbi:MAG: hypothetical protein BZY87_00950 [SAR202 cluster bacterium Io17-Chloro-G6]|nr:MAG: hypothetical protein BZY87_00950 [SAR202 cluster bacterium Io17-Chloro-G6]
MAITIAPSNGTATLNADGTVKYTHDGSETTSDSFKYTIEDSGGVASGEAAVSITITPVNDPPVANDDTGSVAEGGSVDVDVRSNDTDVEDTTPSGVVAITLAPSNGTATLNPDGTVNYTHDGSETMSDSFKYTVEDSGGVASGEAVVSITIAPVNDPPVANDDTGSVAEGGSVDVDVRSNDTDVEDTTPSGVVFITIAPSNGTATLNADGTVKYTHDGSGTTSDSFKYTVEDSGGAPSGEAVVSITITPAAPAGAVHVHDLDALTIKESKGAWRAIVTIELMQSDELTPVNGATVFGTFTQNGTDIPVSCVTDSGTCFVDSGAFPKKSGKDTSFTVTSVSHDTLNYESGFNHDPDLDSNGTTIMLSK